MAAMTHKTIEIEAGRLLCGRVRYAIKAAQMTGEPIQYIEGGGLIVRKFLISGSVDAVDRVAKNIRQYVS